MTLLFLLIGIVFAAIGLSTYFGRDKFWWWSKSTPVIPTGIVFGAFPASIVFFLMAYAFQPFVSLETRLMILNYVGTPLIILTIVLSIWQPSWLKPKWLRWLEKNHRPIIHLLREEARKEGWSVWQQRVKTREGLEEWVAEVRRKRGLEAVE